jgi:DNA-binding NtrC family response regulator
MVTDGLFREDLYYRINVINLTLPALRERIDDIPLLVDFFLNRQRRGGKPKRLAPECAAQLAGYPWPGNVRELENALRAASLFAESNIITARDLTDNLDDLRALTLRTATGASSSPSLTLTPTVERDAPSDEDVSDSDGPLPQIEANATSVAYAQVRLGTVSLSDLKRQIERDCIARALAETKGNITRAAALLGMKRPRLSQLVKQYGLAAVSSEA